MILDEIVLHNFGVYRGRQTFNLTPIAEDRPVILIGALNGNGKTTFLDALQLAFFGKVARCTGRDGIAYEEYLRRSIHRSVPASEGAAIEVAFRRYSAGEEHSYRLHRSWSGANGTVREHFAVVHDGRDDRVLTERWSEHLEEILPHRIAPLFFFDGEKIEQLADVDKASTILSTAVHSLLGLDIVERLQTDLSVFERRKRVDVSGQSEREAIEAATLALEESEKQLKSARWRRAEANTAYLRSVKTLEDARERFQAEGGEAYERRNDLAHARGEAQGVLAAAENSLRQIAGGAAPLLLMTDFLREVDEQAARETEAKKAASVLSVLEDRDSHATAWLEEQGASRKLVRDLERHLATDRAKFADASKGECYLNLTEEARRHLAHLVSNELVTAETEATRALGELERAQSELDDLDRKIDGIPAPESVEALLHAISEAERRVAEHERHLKIIDEEIERLEREVTAQRSALTAAMDKEIQRKFGDEDVERMIHHGRRVRETLSKFRSRVVRHHLSRLERLIVECFGQLAWKDSLIAAVQIDPESFALTLKGGDWREIPSERLSAGERQLLAVSILWALARASGCLAPTVIDTPLGRLDSIHRSNLVERYFPNAGHQVVLLSTDEEIDEHHYKKLAPRISRSFTVEFDRRLGGSSVREGYFFEGRA